ncbi:hypothetical protein C7974DRAFT_304256 [Boeremia exigua]|uniref:uncharacterized protein n=1 Tax=Boeremia exigua TaxID=749465 RepID=UPI001E8CEE28|nr:uncharacterized protein C7974DRAFT_304256 [Boeremia exigua]KAH6639064.1 hypothetical protein C7974DRAFT_304256 [Boeremia exigua]
MQVLINNRDAIAQWLATTAKSRGYLSSKAKGSGKTGRPTYTIPTKEWTPMAEFIAALVDPPVRVPHKLAMLLDVTIQLRQSYSEDITDILAENADKDSNDRHAFFLATLKTVRRILSSQMPAAVPGRTKEPKNIIEILNMFEHLELEEPSETFRNAPDVVPVNEPIYKAERPNESEEDFFALHLLLLDLAKLRTEVSHAWAGYKQGAHDLIAASITTNTAVDLARSMVDESKTTFSKHGGVLRMLQIYYASQCIAAGTTEAHKQRPGDPMNFAMYKVADSLMWPAFLLLDAFTRMHKVNAHPEMKAGYYGTYNPLSNRDRKNDRDKFNEDQILLLEMLPEFYFHCDFVTKRAPPPVEDEFTRELRTMFKTKQVTLPLVFAATLFLDIHHILRGEVDNGFKRLTAATHFVTGDIEEELKFHKDISMDTWPKQNDDFMQQFVDTIEFWVHKDQEREIAPKLNRINTPPPFHLFRQHPWSCGLWKYWAQMQFHELSIVFVNAWGSVMSCAHLYNAVQGGSVREMMWKDLDIVVGMQEPKTIFTGDAPKSSDDCLRRFALAMGASAASLAKSTRTKRGLTLSKRGPKGFKQLGATLQTFRSRICDVNGPKDIRAEDVQKILESSNWDYELDDNDRAQTVYKDIGEASRKAPAKQLSVAKCVGLIRDLLNAEMVEIAYDYLRLHRQCWRLLRAVKDACRDDFIRIFGPDYMQKESQLPFVVGYVLLTASNSQQLGELLIAKQPGIEITSKVLNDAKEVVKAMVESGAGGLIVDHILPQGLDMHIDFEVETEL